MHQTVTRAALLLGALLIVALAFGPAPAPTAQATGAQHSALFEPLPLLDYDGEGCGPMGAVCDPIDD